jgi:predicted FMN-binding regulatory protein PaiB
MIQAKVSISFISAEQAKQNVQQEIPAWNFVAVHAAATSLWNTQLAKLNMSKVNRNVKLLRCRKRVAMKADATTHRHAAWTAAMILFA